MRIEETENVDEEERVEKRIIYDIFENWKGGRRRRKKLQRLLEDMEYR